MITLPLNLPPIDTDEDLERNIKTIAGELYSDRFTLSFMYKNHVNKVEFDKLSDGKSYTVRIGETLDVQERILARVVLTLNGSPKKGVWARKHVQGPLQ